MNRKARFFAWLLLTAMLFLPATAVASEGEASAEPIEYAEETEENFQTSEDTDGTETVEVTESDQYTETGDGSSEILPEESEQEFVPEEGTNAQAVAEGTGTSPLSCMNRWEWDLVQLTNKERVKAGLNPLTVSEVGQSASHTRVKELSEECRAVDPQKLPSYLESIAVSYIGENATLGKDKEYPSDALLYWMTDKTLKEFILSLGVTHIGVGYTYRAVSDANRQLFENVEPENYWEQLLYGVSGETYTGLSVQDSIVVKPGTGIDDMDVYLTASSSTGTSYWLPLIEEFCTTDYDADKIEKQVLTISALGYTKTMTVYVTPEKTGDLNDDGLVNLVDLVRLLKGIVEGKILPGDMNDDGYMNAKDLIHMAHYLLGDSVTLAGKYPVK